MQGVVAGVDVGGTRIKVGLADSSGRLLSCEVLETRRCRDAESFLETIAGEIGKQANAAAASARVAAVGIGCPGRIDFASGKVVWLKSKLEFLEGVPLAVRLRDRLGCPVVCDNDVNTILAGEMRFGAGQGYRDVAGVTVGTGIGGALVLRGCLVRGRNWAAGHFGYMSHDPWGPRHVCGNTGIVEEHASHSGILCQLRRALEAGEASVLTESLARGEEPGLREVFEAADAGDPLGCRLADRLYVSSACSSPILSTRSTPNSFWWEGASSPTAPVSSMPSGARWRRGSTTCHRTPRRSYRWRWGTPRACWVAWLWGWMPSLEWLGPEWPRRRK